MAKKHKFKEKCKALAAEFKKFVSKGNVVDMAVGVVIGGAFSAIVKSLTDILLQIATWGVPGGLSGLVTVLPALSSGQMPPAGLEISYTVEQFRAAGFDTLTQKMYTQYGNMFYYSKCAIINWGAFINAIISFLIVGLTLFIIVKVVKYIGAKRKAFEAKMREEYYQKHPEERPEEKPAPVKPITELDVLKDMKQIMASQAYNVRPRTSVSSHHK